MLPLGEEVDDFARGFLEYENDPYLMAERFSQICGNRKAALEGPENIMEHQERMMWEAEEKTWVLLSQLYQIRTKPQPPPLDIAELRKSATFSSSSS